MLCKYYNQALQTTSLADVETETQLLLERLQSTTAANSPPVLKLQGIKEHVESLQAGKSNTRLTSWLPAVKWHGVRNQYHQWITGLVSQKPLVSLVDGRNAWSKIYDALKWTLLLNGVSFLIALMAGVVIGILIGNYD